MTIDSVNSNQIFLNDIEFLLLEVEKLLLGVDLECKNEIRSKADSIKSDKVMRSYVRMTEVTYILEKLLCAAHNNDIKFHGHVDSLIEATDELRIAIAILQRTASNTNHTKQLY